MANCSYLFLSNTNFLRMGNTEAPPMRHVSTAPHDVPFAFKVLLSGEPRAIERSRGGPRSSFGLIGDRRSGVDRLEAFLHRIDLPIAQPVIQHTLSFLNKPEHQSAYFVLDPADVFDLTDESHTKQAQKLIDEIENIDATFEYELARLIAPLGPITIGPGVMPGLIARLFGAKQQPAKLVPFPQPLYRFEQAGLLNWHESSD